MVGLGTDAHEMIRQTKKAHLVLVVLGFSHVRWILFNFPTFDY
jgi:hypothetical protein